MRPPHKRNTPVERMVDNIEAFDERLQITKTLKRVGREIIGVRHAAPWLITALEVSDFGQDVMRLTDSVKRVGVARTVFSSVLNVNGQASASGEAES